MFVIAGVGGNTGSIVANTLLEKGQKVRVLVRNEAKAKPFADRGAEVAVGDVEDRASLEKALRGARGFYVMLPPAPTASDFLALADRRVAAIADALRATKTEHVVLLSSVGAQHADGTGPIRGLHRAEKAFAGAAKLTAIRAAYFMENWAASLGAVKDGVLPTFNRADVAFPMIATKDIGALAAAVLLEGPKAQRRVIELAGPREYSPNDVAAIVSKLAGRKVEVQQGPEEAIVPAFQSFGMSADMAGLYREMIHGINTGRVAFEDGNERVRGETPIEDVLSKLIAGK